MSTLPASNSPYRADIDGLRAVAVVPVVLFHAGLRQFSGGFVGVDVFFVISGFLITTVIQNEIKGRTFSVFGFYERRVRRIVPSLFIVLLITSALAAIISPPDVLVSIGKAAAASALFSSNILFWREAGYFDDSMHRNALLHTWSLSVEEQFYIVYPLLLGAILLLPPIRARLAVAACFAVSLAFAIWATSQAPTIAFYLAPLRAWELLLGALLALGAAPRLRQPALREAAAAIGLLLIAWSVLTYSRTTPFPGMAALAPCLGAALVIHAGADQPTFVGRVLAWRPVVFVGLISYALYLWHWPIIVFAKELLGDQLRYREIAVCIILSVALATASWLLLERPIRRRIILPTRKALFATGGACLASAAVIGAILVGSGGMAWRYPPAARTILATTGQGGGPLFRTGTCFVTPEDPHFDRKTCLRLDPAKPNILLMGDSHAAHFWYGLDRVFSDANILQATASGCRPVLGGSVQGKDVCRPMIDFVVRDFLPEHPVDTVILAASWWNDETDLPLLPHTVACLKQYAAHVVVIGPINLYDRPLPELLADDIRAAASRTDSHRVKQIAPLDDRMNVLARDNGIPYLSIYRLLCPGPSCRKYAAPGLPMQFDDGHLTAAGSVYVAQRWMRDRAFLPPPVHAVSSPSVPCDAPEAAILAAAHSGDGR